LAFLNGDSIYFQDQLEKERSVYRVKVLGGEPQRVYAFGDVLQSPAYYLFNGLDAKGWL
jgi:hypothetical protein